MGLWLSDPGAGSEAWAVAGKEAGPCWDVAEQLALWGTPWKQT